MKNDNNIIIEIYITREKIEKAIIEYNTKYFKKVQNIKVFQDKTCNQLNEDKIRDKILEGRLQRENCDDENMH